MTKTAIETLALDELRRLPPEQAQEALDFILFLRARAAPGRAIRPAARAHAGTGDLPHR